MIGSIIKKHKDTEQERDEKWPDRHRTIHKYHCDGCPSHCNAIAGETDAETEEVKSWPKSLIAKEGLFVCYKRPNKLCKGLCDVMSIDQEFLDSVYDPSRKTNQSL